jgi:hypothetical protein
MNEPVTSRGVVQPFDDGSGNGDRQTRRLFENGLATRRRNYSLQNVSNAVDLAFNYSNARKDYLKF